MPVGGDIATATGTQIYIGPVAAPSVNTPSLFAALTPYVPIGLVETIAPYGDAAGDTSFAAISDSRVRHTKSARDAGTMQLTVAHDPGDAGQLALIAAELTNYNYAFKVVLSDTQNSSQSGTVDYFRGMVTSKKLNVGSNGGVIKREFIIAINSPVYEVLATTF